MFIRFAFIKQNACLRRGFHRQEDHVRDTKRSRAVEVVTDSRIRPRGHPETVLIANRRQVRFPEQVPCIVGQIIALSIGQDLPGLPIIVRVLHVNQFAILEVRSRRTPANGYGYTLVVCFGAMRGIQMQFATALTTQNTKCGIALETDNLPCLPSGRHVVKEGFAYCLSVVPVQFAVETCLSHRREFPVHTPQVTDVSHSATVRVANQRLAQGRLRGVESGGSASTNEEYARPICVGQTVSYTDIQPGCMHRASMRKQGHVVVAVT